MATVVIRNPSHRRAVRFGGRTLAGRYSGGRSTIRVSVGEFVGVPVQGRIRTGQLVLDSFSKPEHAAAWAQGGLPALLAALEGKAPAPANEAPEVAETLEVKPAPVEAPPVEQDPTAEKPSSVAPPPDEKDPTPVEAATYSRQALDEMPWSGPDNIRDLAAELGVSGRSRSDLVEGILALQEA